jgi:hypothetical protein
VSERIWVATRKGLFAVERRGSRGWGLAGCAFVGDNVSMVLPDAGDGTMHAALDHGHFGVKLHRSRDGGKTWEETPAPAFPKKPDGEDPPNAAGGPAVPWRVLRVWSLEAGHAEQRGVLWCGTLPGGLFRSADGGSSWDLVRPLWDHPKRAEWFGGGADEPGIHSILVDARDERHVTVGVSCGGVWETRDGAASWDCRAEGMWAAYLPPGKERDPNLQDPHRVVRCRARPDCLWAQHHNGIFRSTDDAASWEEVRGIQPSSFGFAVAVHPHDPEVAWFVPAVKDERRIPFEGQVVVARTRDGGRSSEVLRNGLPQEHAYDITYRHGLDVDETGDVLAFGSTTGSLWVSGDGGDSWQTVAGHLPPIYCVRFAQGA